MPAQNSGRELQHDKPADISFVCPLAALQSLDRAGCVIYVGTFTKMLFNALRLGFLALPAHLVEPFSVARTLTDRHPPTLDQAILAEFILDGHFGHHVRRMRFAVSSYSKNVMGTKILQFERHNIVLIKDHA